MSRGDFGDLFRLGDGDRKIAQCARTHFENQRLRFIRRIRRTDGTGMQLAVDFRPEVLELSDRFQASGHGCLLEVK